MESFPQDNKKSVWKAVALFGRFFVSQILGIAAALVVVFLEAGILRWMIVSMPPDRMEKARALALSGFSTTPWYVGPVLYFLIFAAALSAAAICQYLFLWASPSWRETVYYRNRKEPPRNIREGVGKRWTLFCWMLPIAFALAPVFLWWVSR
jgi:hypothetical protein